MPIPHHDTTAYWLEVFSRVNTIDSLELLFVSWWKDFRQRFSDDARARVILAKDLRKSQLARKTS